MRSTLVHNVGGVDRVIRGAAGVGLIVAGILAWGAADGRLGGIAAVLAGVVFITTAAVRFCPLYVPLGVRTCRRG